MLKIDRQSEKLFLIEFSGAVSSQELETELDKFLEQSRDVKGGKLIYRIDDFDFPGLGLVMVKLQRLPKLLGLFSRFDKAAVVSDKNWLNRLAEFEGMLIPGFEIKAFAKEDEAAAMTWLDGKTE